MKINILVTDKITMTVNTVITSTTVAMASQSLRQMRCSARMTSPELGLSRLRLSVSEPRCCCPCLSKRRVIANFTFGGDGWKITHDGYYENFTDYQSVDATKFQKLHEDLRLEFKCWTRRVISKKILRLTLGDFLDLLESRPDGLSLHIVASPTVVQLRWGEEELKVSAKVVTDPSTVHDDGS